MDGYGGIGKQAPALGCAALELNASCLTAVACPRQSAHCLSVPPPLPATPHGAHGTPPCLQVVSDYLTAYDTASAMMEAKGRPVVVYTYRMAFRRPAAAAAAGTAGSSAA